MTRAESWVARLGAAWGRLVAAMRQAMRSLHRLTLRMLGRPARPGGAVVALPLSGSTVHVVVPGAREEVTLDGREMRLLHVAIPPRSGWRYHFLVETDVMAALTWDEVYTSAMNRMVRVDPLVRAAVACPSTLCELTALENVVES